MDIHGFLYSQIGYDIGDPMRAIIRSTDRNHVSDGATFEVRSEDASSVAASGDVRYWGEVWHSHWWEIDFSGIDEPGSYIVSVTDRDKTLYKSDPIEIDNHLLWRETIEPIALDQLEARAEAARNRIGWKDCGAEWREANSHATTIIGLNELMSTGFQWMTESQVNRLRNQIIHGCDYLSILQDTAARNGEPDGALVHEIPNHMVVIPGDAAQSCVAFAQAGRLLADTDAEISDEYINRACAAINFLIDDARPYGGAGFSSMNHGADTDFTVPPEFMTRDLVMMVWGCVELWAAGRIEYQHHAARFAREVMARQVPEECAEGGTDGDPLLYGHFYTFTSAEFTEKANTHHGVGHDTGITQKSFDGCVLWKDSVPEGEAVPYSQIYGVGRRWTGNWTGIRGTIPNGFDVNPQFQLVVEPSKEHDEPLLYTDEDWIPHGAGFLAGLTAHRGKIRFE